MFYAILAFNIETPVRKAFKSTGPDIANKLENGMFKTVRDVCRMKEEDLALLTDLTGEEITSIKNILEKNYMEMAMPIDRMEILAECLMLAKNLDTIINTRRMQLEKSKAKDIEKTIRREVKEGSVPIPQELFTDKTITTVLNLLDDEMAKRGLWRDRIDAAKYRRLTKQTPTV